MHSHVIPASEYRRERWRNGLGWTRQIFRSGEEQSWNWRVSIAEIDADAAFSVFPGIDRELVLLSGKVLRLHFADGDVAVLTPLHAGLRFNGERAVRGELTSGAVKVVNLMWRRESFVTTLSHRKLGAPMTISPAPYETWVVHLIAGHARFDKASALPAMSGGDTALLCAASDSCASYSLDGDGTMLLARITPL